MYPFKALYGYDAPTFADMVFDGYRAQNENYWLQETQYILIVLKENLQVSQNRYKLYVDKHRVERSFQVGDMVFLRL